MYCVYFHFTAVVNKLIKEIVPNIRVTNDARDLLLNCCTGNVYVRPYQGLSINALYKSSFLTSSYAPECVLHENTSTSYV